MMLSETHLVSQQVSADWIKKDLYSDYTLFASCVPAKNPFQLGAKRNPGQARWQDYQRAGVAILVRKACFADQYMSMHAVPSTLKGHLGHVSVHSSESHPLHVLAAYCPPGFCKGSKQSLPDIFASVKKLRANLTANGSRLLLAGDFDGTLHEANRSNNKLLPMD